MDLGSESKKMLDFTPLLYDNLIQNTLFFKINSTKPGSNKTQKEESIYDYKKKYG